MDRIEGGSIVILAFLYDLPTHTYLTDSMLTHFLKTTGFTPNIDKKHSEHLCVVNVILVIGEVDSDEVLDDHLQLFIICNQSGQESQDLK